MRPMLFAVVCFAVAACVLLAKPRTAPMVSLANEKVFISQIADSSSLSTFEGFPKEKSSQEFLTVHFRELYKNLFAEFKRCEKFGYFEMVEDSVAATVRLQLTIRPYSFQKDTLTLPVRIELRHRTGLDTYTNTVQAWGVYRSKNKPKSPLHYLDNLLADYRRHFPYRKCAAFFYPPQ
jgi:hypothetical protein